MNDYILIIESVSIHPMESQANRRWKFDEDGNVYFSSNALHKKLPPIGEIFYFGTDFAKIPNLKINSKEKQEIKKLLLNLKNLKDIYEESNAEDGWAIRLRIKLDDKEKIIILKNVCLLPEIKEFFTTLNGLLKKAGDKYLIH